MEKLIIIAVALYSASACAEIKKPSDLVWGEAEKPGCNNRGFCVNVDKDKRYERGSDKDRTYLEKDERREFKDPHSRYDINDPTQPNVSLKYQHNW